MRKRQPRLFDDVATSPRCVHPTHPFGTVSPGRRGDVHIARDLLGASAVGIPFGSGPPMVGWYGGGSHSDGGEHLST